MKYKVYFSILISAILLLSACHTYTPVFYENSHYKSVGKEQADKDITETAGKADEMGLNSKWKKHTTKTAIATAAGGGIGAAV